MPISAPTLGGQSLTVPTIYRNPVIYRGGLAELADGTVVIDLVQTGAKRAFHLEWVSLTEAQVATLLTAFATVKDSSATLVDPFGTSYTVTRDPNRPDLELDWFPVAGGTVRARATLGLREV